MVVLLGVLCAGFFVLGGLDYGVALIARGRADLARIAPFFLGNQVWLVAAAGLLLGAYPANEGELLTAHRIPIGVGLLGSVIVVAGLGMGLFARVQVLARVGALVAAVGWGAALGSVAGSSLAGSWVTGSAVAGALLLPTLLALHGWAFLRRRWVVLGLTSPSIAASVVAVGTTVDWHPAPPSTLAIVAPTAWTLVSLLVVIQAFSWWLLRPRAPLSTDSRSM
jgi:cytochrome bd-type quinol oxidase subunit 2